MKVKSRAIGNFTRPGQILIVPKLVIIHHPNTIHIPNIGVTRCLRETTQKILNIQKNLCLCTPFQRKSESLERNQRNHTTFLALNHMPLLRLPWAKECLPELMKHLKRRPVVWCFPIKPHLECLTQAFRAITKIGGRHVAENSLTRARRCVNQLEHYQPKCVHVFNGSAKKFFPAPLDGVDHYLNNQQFLPPAWKDHKRALKQTWQHNSCLLVGPKERAIASLWLRSWAQKGIRLEVAT